MVIPAALNTGMKFVNSAANYVSPELVRRGLEKISPKFKSYFAQSIAYGFSANQALDYLVDHFKNKGQQQYQQALEKRGQAQQLRPDEMEAQAQIQNAQLPGKVLKTGLALAAPLMAGGGEAAPQEEAPAESPIPQMAQKVGKAAAPVTQAYKATEGLATPVISGRAVAQAGMELNRRKNLAAKTAPQAVESTKSAATPFDMLKKHNPEIGAFMESELGKGRSPFEAAAAARNKKSLKNPIRDLEEETAQPFEGIIAHIFGLGSPNQQAAPTQSASSAQSGDWMAAQKQLAGLIQAYNQSKGLK